MRRKIVIGLTGGIASGKSVALSEFKKLGAKVLDCDQIARDIVEKNHPAFKKIVRHFGSVILKEDGSLDRQALAKIIFADDRKKRRLEKIVHPEVKRVLKREIGKVKSGLIVIDIPLLFEAKFGDLVDKIVVVWVPQKMQIERLMKRNGHSRSEALRRIRIQWPLNRKRKLADFVIDNSGNRMDIRSQVRKVFGAL